jgi:predicted O-methyltransferase YrrM
MLNLLFLRERDLTKADEVLREIEALSKKAFLPIVGPKKGQFLEEITRELKPKRVLEVGTLIGYSAILIGKELGRGTHIITIEIHPGEAQTAEQNMKRAEILPNVKVVVGDAKEVIPKLRDNFDLVFIDAEKSEYIDYLRLVEDKLHEGSVIVADNAGIFADQMKDYLDYVRSSGRYKSKYIPVGGDGLEISTKL